MNIVFWLLVLTVIENGFLAGASFDVALVKLPTRKRIGPVAYAQFGEAMISAMARSSTLRWVFLP